MQFQEYPKALYKGDQTTECVIVNDEKEEAAKRKGGFKMLGEPEDKPKGKAAKQSEPEEKPKDDGPAGQQNDQPQGDKAAE